MPALFLRASAMEIPLHNLPRAGRRFEDYQQFVDVMEDRGLQGLRELHVDLVATGDDQRLSLKGGAKAIARLLCSRCLKEFDRPTSTPLDLVYALTRQVLEEDLDVERLVEGKVVDPQPEIIGVLLSEIPFQTLCRESCRGLCSQCGADLNEGPCGCEEKNTSPFRVLKKLQERDGE